MTAAILKIVLLSVLKVVTVDGNMCSGTIVGARTVLTAAHCNNPDKLINVSTGEEIPIMSYYRPDPNVDLLIIKTALPLMPKGYSPLPIASLPPRPGDPLYILGLGCCRSPHIQEQKYDYLERTIYSYDLITTGEVCYGDSGSAMVNDKGELVGITWGLNEAGEEDKQKRTAHAIAVQYLMFDIPIR